jgi:hypothetical protein
MAYYEGAQDHDITSHQGESSTGVYGSAIG